MSARSHGGLGKGSNVGGRGTSYAIVLKKVSIVLLNAISKHIDGFYVNEKALMTEL